MEEIVMSFKSSGRCLIIQFFAIAFLPVMLLAQGEDNPTGVTGVYNGNVTTAGNFDPFTGNAMRGPIDDIVMPSSVGAYPLKWTRYLNSRNSGGFWSFSYKDYKLGLDSMVFPDGRVIQFTNACTSGVEESTGKWNGKDAIFLADGGKVLFDTIPSAYYPGWTDMPSGLVDPYGQLTTIHQQYISTDSNGIAHYLVDRITEPGGRYLQINWITDGGGTKQIGSVQAFDGVNPQPIQSVTYTWTQWSTSTKYVLSRADYSDGTSANYQYINAGNDLMTCDDVRYAGPMRQIAYQYLGTGGKLQSENHLVSGQAGEMVSSVAYPATTPGTGVEQRTETRGDGPTRTFAYMKGGRDMDGTCLRPDPANGKLVSYTDFLGHTTTLTYEGGDPDISPHYGFIQTVTDPNGHTTTYTRQTNSWGITTITHPDGSTIQQTFWPNNSQTSPYYLQSRTDELGHTTNYTRDANNRITRKDYPDGAYETFTYNNFGEVLTHVRAQSLTPLVTETESFVYDSRGLKTSYTDATGGTTTYTYYGANDPIASNAWIDRLKTVTHPANASGLQATDTYEYDRAFDVNGLDTGAPIAGRGLVTKITHADATYQLFGHDIYGEKLWQ